MQQENFIKTIQSIVNNLLENQGFFTHEWHLGTIESVNANGTLNVYIDGSSIVTPSVPANPDITFVAGDKVWIHFVNRNPNNLFIPYKRQVTTE